MTRIRLELSIVTLLFLGVVASYQNASACSAVLLVHGKSLVAARNYDWHLGHGMIMSNQRDMTKQALSFDKPAVWTSKYGSVTLNQYGRELPCEGMNEKGLAMAMLWLTETKYPKSDKRPSLTVAQWLQYQLDTAATIEDVVNSDNTVRITPFGGAKVHYFLADATGDCATIEFLDGKMVVHRRSNMVVPVITNHSYSASIDYLKQFQGFGGTLPTPNRSGSLDRFVRLSSVSRDLDLGDEKLHDVGLSLLDEVAKGKATQWQVAYDLSDKKLHFRTAGHRQTRMVNLAKLDYSCQTPVKVFDMQAKADGDITAKLRDYTVDDNRTLVDKSMVDASRVANMPAAIREIVINYPEAFCRPAAE